MNIRRSFQVHLSIDLLVIASISGLLGIRLLFTLQSTVVIYVLMALAILLLLHPLICLFVFFYANWHHQQVKSVFMLAYSAFSMFLANVSLLVLFDIGFMFGIPAFISFFGKVHQLLNLAI